MKTDFWLMAPFNTLFCITFAFFLLLLAAAGVLLKNKDDHTKRVILSVVCMITFIGFFVYKYYLSIDAEYDLLTADREGFNWWNELPMHLCNINMTLIPVAVLSKNRPLMNFCFFVAPLGAMMALAMPTAGFSGYSLLLPRMLGFYGTHFMIVIEGLAIVTFGLYRPEFRDLPGTFLAAVGLTFMVFLFDTLLRFTGIYTRANYFYTYETEGNVLLNLFHSWIPVPFLYLIPCLAILGAYMFLIMSFFKIGGTRRRK